MAKSNVYSKLDQIKDKVGKPYFSSENVLLYNIDCSIFLESLDSNIFDLTITSPPYNIGKEFRYNDKLVDLEDSYRHSKWLSFMSKRLRLAKKLLKHTMY